MLGAEACAVLQAEVEAAELPEAADGRQVDYEDLRFLDRAEGLVAPGDEIVRRLLALAPRA